MEIIEYHGKYSKSFTDTIKSKIVHYDIIGIIIITIKYDWVISKINL